MIHYTQTSTSSAEIYDVPILTYLLCTKYLKNGEHCQSDLAYMLTSNQIITIQMTKLLVQTSRKPDVQRKHCNRTVALNLSLLVGKPYQYSTITPSTSNAKRKN